MAVLRRAPDGAVTEVVAAPWSARSGVHEYGGGAWWVREGVLWFTDWATQRLHRVAPGGEPTAAHARTGGATRPPLRRRCREPRRHDAALRPGGAPRRRPRGHQHDRAARRARAEHARGRRGGPGLRVGPAVEPGWDGVLLARVGSPGHAVGRHPPRGRRGWVAHRGGGRRRARVGRSAHVGARRLAVVLRRPHRVLEPVPVDGPAHGIEPMVDLGKDIGFPGWVFGQSLLRVPRRRPVGVQLQRRRARAARRPRARTPVASRPSTCPTR